LGSDPNCNWCGKKAVDHGDEMLHARIVAVPVRSPDGCLERSWVPEAKVVHEAFGRFVRELLSEQ